MALNPFDLLDQRLQNIENLLIDLQSAPLTQPHPVLDSEKLLNVKQCADFLSLSVPTIYTLISKGEIPVMKRSKRCYFSKAELINYLKAGRKKMAIRDSQEREPDPAKKRAVNSKSSAK